MLPIQLREILDDLDAAPVECDGMCRLVVTRLCAAKIEHRAMVGSITLGDKVMSPHWWVEVEDMTIDYRARMWLGDIPLVPHGVFRQDTCATVYKGIEVVMEPISDALASILMISPKDFIKDARDE